MVILNEGRVEQSGTPEEVFQHPASEFVMRFLGSVNLFQGRTEGERMYVRPHELEISTTEVPGASMKADIRRLWAAGGQVKAELAGAGGEVFYIEMSHERRSELQLREGQQVFVNPRKFRVFPQT